MSARMKRNVLEKVLGRTSAVLLRLRIDHHCLKYKGKRMRNEMKRGKREAVRVGQKVICSQLSCTSGRVKREGKSRGEKRVEITKEK